ncbi:antiviral reverse transcriptase Drt3a [Vibrio sp. E150_018]
MLKQVFNKEQLSKVISSTDVWGWNLLSKFGDVDAALEQTVEYWKRNGLNLSPMKKKVVNGKTVFTPSRAEDAFAIKLVDRFIRRIYKVRQSDRSRIVKQIITLLKDSGDYHVIRLDIKNCYESISFDKIITKFQDDLILAPDCIELLNKINQQLKLGSGFSGLPRGLSISPTLAELYLEQLDRRVALNNDVIYSARYVDDIILITTDGKKEKIKRDIDDALFDLGLKLNQNDSKKYSGPTKSAHFDYLGYSIKVTERRGKSNKVNVSISNSKINKIKFRILKSLCENKKSKNIKLLKRRVEFLSLLKVVKKGGNGHLLAGIAHNYQYSTDDFECLKSVDGFLLNQLHKTRFNLTPIEIEKMKKISFYGNVRKRNVGKFSRKQTAKIMQIWKNA